MKLVPALNIFPENPSDEKLNGDFNVLENMLNRGTCTAVLYNTILHMVFIADLAGYCLQTMWQLDGSAGSVSEVLCRHSTAHQQTVGSYEMDCILLHFSAFHF